MSVAATITSFFEFSVLRSLMITLLIMVLIWYAKWSFKRRRMLRISSRIPFPKNKSYYPIIGHGHHFLGDMEDTLRCILEFASTSVNPVTMHMGPKVYHFIVRPEDMEVVLNSSKTLAKDDLYRFTIPGGGNSLMNLDVETWRKHRKLIAPTMNLKILESFVPIFVKQSNILADLLGEEGGKEPDVSGCVIKCTLDCVFETSLGVRFNFQTRKNKVDEIINRGTDILMLRIYNVFYHVDFIYNLTAISREERDISRNFKSATNKVVQEKKLKYMKRRALAEEQPEAEILEGKKGNFYLDHLIGLSFEGNVFTDESVIDETQSYIIAASDTTTTVVAFTLTCIALFPDVQKKVYEEILDVVGKERDIESSDLSKLKYTEMVIKEAMRLFPVAPVVLRKVQADLQLETCTLAEGVGLVLSIMSLHRNPLYFKDPLKFIPERFTPEETAKRHPYSYLPFSGGPRNCIGPRYGMMLAKCMVAAVVRKFVVTTEYKSLEEIRLKQTFVLKPVLGYKLGFNARGIKSSGWHSAERDARCEASTSTDENLTELPEWLQ